MESGHFPTNIWRPFRQHTLALEIMLDHMATTANVLEASAFYRTRKALKSGAGKLLDILLPRHCLMCGMASGGSNLCPPCRADLPKTAQRCKQCGLPLPGNGDARCGACLQRTPPWDRVVAALDYCFPTDVLVQRFKFSRNLACGKVLAEELAYALNKEGEEPKLPHAVVPVPLHRIRHASRTFNQSELLAKRAAHALGVPFMPRLLLRNRQTHAQSGLDARSRRRNTRGAFHCRSKQAIGLQHVALVDDVMTTGATLEACTRELKRCGVGEVSIWVVARAPPP